MGVLVVPYELAQTVRRQRVGRPTAHHWVPLREGWTQTSSGHFSVDAENESHPPHRTSLAIACIIVDPLQLGKGSTLLQGECVLVTIERC